MSSQRDMLRDRLKQNYADYIAELHGKTADELIAMASEIAAAKQLVEELADACSEDDVEFLLRFADPLEAVRGSWADEMDGCHDEEMRHMVWELRDRELFPEEDVVPPAKPDQSKEKTAATLQPWIRAAAMDPVREITVDELYRMKAQGGLVFPNCPMEPHELIDQINQAFTYAGILRNGSEFKTAMIFRHNGTDNVLLPFQGVDLERFKLVAWQVMTYGVCQG